MTKGERLIWDLFMKVREVLPATADNSQWATEWAVMFHEMERPAGQEAVAPEHQIGAGATASSADHDADDDGGDDDMPHVRSAPKRKRK